MLRAQPHRLLSGLSSTVTCLSHVGLGATAGLVCQFVLHHPQRLFHLGLGATNMCCMTAASLRPRPLTHPPVPAFCGSWSCSWKRVSDVSCLCAAALLCPVAVLAWRLGSVLAGPWFQGCDAMSCHVSHDDARRAVICKWRHTRAVICTIASVTYASYIIHNIYVMLTCSTTRFLWCHHVSVNHSPKSLHCIRVDSQPMACNNR